LTALQLNLWINNRKDLRFPQVEKARISRQHRNFFVRPVGQENHRMLARCRKNFALPDKRCRAQFLVTAVQMLVSADRSNGLFDGAGNQPKRRRNILPWHQLCKAQPTLQCELVKKNQLSECFGVAEYAAAAKEVRNSSGLLTSVVTPRSWLAETL